MSASIIKLASIGSSSIRTTPVDINSLSGVAGHVERNELERLLSKKNGFYAFEGALHVLPDIGDNAESGLVAWNQGILWRQEYQGMADEGVFFAEDVFGVQFVLKGKTVFTFDPETGAFEIMANSLDEWARNILTDFGLWTGHQVAHDWQVGHGTIPRGSRLLPVRPFVLGGEYSVANVRAVDAVEGMRYRASIAVQIRDLPDGAAVKLKVIE